MKHYDYRLSPATNVSHIDCKDCIIHPSEKTAVFVGSARFWEVTHLICFMLRIDMPEILNASLNEKCNHYQHLSISVKDYIDIGLEDAPMQGIAGSTCRYCSTVHLPEMVSLYTVAHELVHVAANKANRCTRRCGDHCRHWKRRMDTFTKNHLDLTLDFYLRGGYTSRTPEVK